jgi:hypothetical protein
VRGVIFGHFPLVYPDEGITDKSSSDKSSSRDHISKAMRLKSPQNIHKKHTYLNIIEQLYWDYTISILHALILMDYFFPHTTSS